MIKNEIINYIADLCNKARQEGYDVGYQKGFEDAQKQTDEIKIGDEVYYEKIGDAGVVTRIIRDEPTYFYGINSQGKLWCGGVKYKKTGRHFPQIAEVVKQLGGETRVSDV